MPTIEDQPKSFFLSWQFVALKILILCALAITLEKPTGSLEGKIALEMPRFGLFSYDISKNHVYAIAIGPRGQFSDERGVWIKPDGSFRIDQLPVGEYQLKVRAPGFGNEYKSGLFVDEAKVTKLSDPVRLSILNPSISVASNRRVFTTKETPNFWINTTGTGHLTVEVYKKDLLATAANHGFGNFDLSTNFYFSKNIQGTPANPFAKEPPLLTFKRELHSDWEDSANAQFKLDRPLPPGEYVICAEGYSYNGADLDRELGLFMVSDLGLITKRAPNATVVRAIDLNTLKPVAGATITAHNWEDFAAKPLIAQTDANGFARLPGLRPPQGKYSSLHATQPGEDMTSNESDHDGQDYSSSQIEIDGRFGASKAYDSMSYWYRGGQRYDTYIYTERPVYRLGQTVFFKGIVRQGTLDGHKNPGSGVPLAISITDQDSNEVASESVKTSSHGSFHGSYTVPADGKTGAYSITISFPNKETCTGTFEVAQYRKPEYLVEVKADTPRIIEGNKLKAHVHATYFFGGPVANARVKYSIASAIDYSARKQIHKQPAYYDFFDSWNSDDSYMYSDYAGDYLTDGYTTTDANGDGVIEFDTAAITTDPTKEPNTTDFADKRYTIQAEVTDISRMTVVGNTTAQGTAGDFALFVTPDSYVASVGQAMGVTVEARTYDGQPVANKAINLKVERLLFDNSTYESRGSQTVADATVTTGPDGKVHSEIMAADQWPSDTFYVAALAKDAGGRTVFNATTLWVDNYRYPFVASGSSADRQPVTLKLDKPVYKVGETAKVLITAPLHGDEGLDAIVSVEGLKLYDLKTVPLKSTAITVEVPIKKEYMPNAYVDVVVVDKKRQYFTQEALLQVSPEPNFLNIAIDSDKQKYKPGETAKYTIKATHEDGSPAANTELSLGVVDESIYSVRPEQAQDIRSFFYAKRDNNVVTSCSFPEEYSGGPDKSEPHVRKDFKDVAAWMPELVTDKNGVATASVKMPDNLTTWRATVRGIDMETDVGSAIQKVVCTQDLICRLALPRFFSQGDEGLLTAVVHNYASTKQHITLTLTASNNFKTDTPLAQGLDLDPEKAGRFSWPVTVTASGTAVVKVKALGQTAADAVEQKIPVRPLGIPAFTCTAGVLTQDTQSVTIPSGLAGDAVRSTATYQLDLASSSLGPVLGNFNALIDYPYGCTEQTMSRLMPSVVAMQLHTKLNQPLAKADTDKFDKVYAKAMEKLTSYHHQDGGWGWWQNDESNDYLTALVLRGMKLLKECGYDVDDSFITGGCEWLDKESVALFAQLSDPKLVIDDWSLIDRRSDLASMLYTLSQFGKSPSPATTAWLTSHASRYSPETLSYLCLTYHNLHNDSVARIFYNKLIGMANVSPDMIDWEHTQAMCKRLQLLKVDDYTYRFTSVESTALALRCVLAMEPTNFDRIESTKKWIMLHRTQDGWDNTKTTAEVFLVLLQDELQARQMGSTGNFSAHVTLDQKLVDQFTANASNLYASQKTLSLSIPQGPTKLVIDKDGPGRLYYNSLMTYFRNLKPGDQVAEKAMPKGVKISRQFFRMVPSQKGADGSIHFTTQAITDGKVKAGETIMMRIFVQSPVSLPYVMVDAALPSGGEVVEHDLVSDNVTADGADDSASADQSSDDSGISGDWQPAWWSHQDILDDRIVFFGAEMPAGKSEFRAMIRMELPGTINVNPVSFSGMYTNSVRGYSPLDQLKVSE